jgi:CubicO group peptidase (beta-lactamase class C family)
MDAGVSRVTLSQLLSHTSGCPSDNEDFDALLANTVKQPGNLNEQRYWMVQHRDKAAGPRTRQRPLPIPTSATPGRRHD